MGSMKDLFGDTPWEPSLRYPNTPGYKAGSDTSKAAAVSMIPTAANLRGKIADYIRQRGGATYDEVVVDLRLTPQSVSARLRELVLLGVIEDSGGRRQTRAHRDARIYVPRGRFDETR